MNESILSRLRRQRPRQLFYHYGARFSVPFPILKAAADAADIARHPRDYWQRRHCAAEMTQDSPWRDRMTREDGFTQFSAAELPGAEEIVSLCRRILDEKKHSIDELDPRVTFHKLLTQEEIGTHPELVEFALSEPFVHTIAGYLGILPRLHDIDLWLSPPVEQLRSSHFYHLDKPEVNYIGAFMNIFDVGEADGPLTIVPARHSEHVESQTHYRRRYMLGTDVRIDDAEMVAQIGDGSEIPLTGAAGDVSMFDTSRCFHYGSRCKTGARVVLQFRYGPAHKISGPAVPYKAQTVGDDGRNLELLLAASPGGPLPRG